MLRTLFHIPTEIWDIPVFGWGWALWIWTVVSIIVLWSSYHRYGFGPETRGHLPVMLIFGFLLYQILPRLQIGGPDEAGVPIRGFGVMLLIAVVAAVALAVRRARQLGFNGELVYALAVWVFVSGILGARVFYVVQKWEQFDGQSLFHLLAGIVNVTQGGIVIYGGLIGGAIGFVAFVLRNGLPWLAVADLIAPSVLLGMAIGRIGCFLNGCCYGGECEYPWAVRFPQDSPPYVDQLRTGQLLGVQLVVDEQGHVNVADVIQGSPAEEAGLQKEDQIVAIGGHDIAQLAREEQRSESMVVGDLLQIAKAEVQLQTVDGRVIRWPVSLPDRSRPLHPTQLYSAMNALLLCVFLLAYFPFQKRDGESMALFMLLYPISRFLLEIIRDDELAILRTGLTISQNVSVGLCVVSLAMWVYVLSRPRGTCWSSSFRQPEAAS